MDCWWNDMQKIARISCWEQSYFSDKEKLQIITNYMLYVIRDVYTSLMLFGFFFSSSSLWNVSTLYNTCLDTVCGITGICNGSIFVDFVGTPTRDVYTSLPPPMTYWVSQLTQFINRIFILNTLNFRSINFNLEKPFNFPDIVIKPKLLT